MWSWVQNNEARFISPTTVQDYQDKLNVWLSQTPNDCTTCQYARMQWVRVETHGKTLTMSSVFSDRTWTPLPHGSWLCLYSEIEEFLPVGYVASVLSGPGLDCTRDITWACPLCHRTMAQRLVPLVLTIHGQGHKTEEKTVDRKIQFIRHIWKYKWPWDVSGVATTLPRSFGLGRVSPAEATEISQHIATMASGRWAWLRHMHQFIARRHPSEQKQQQRHSPLETPEQKQQHLPLEKPEHQQLGKPPHQQQQAVGNEAWCELLIQLDAEWIKSFASHMDVTASSMADPVTLLVDSHVWPRLSKNKRHLCWNRYLAEQIYQHQFQCAWWIASRWNLAELESWLEAERHVFTHMIHVHEMDTTSNSGKWCERFLHPTLSTLTWRQLHWQRERKWVVSGFQPHEWTWLHQTADARGVVVADGEGADDVGSDLFVRVGKSYTYMMRQRFTDRPLVASLIHAANVLTLDKDDRRWFLGQQKLHMHLGLSPVASWPGALTSVTDIPTECPAPRHTTLNLLCQHYRVAKDNATNDYNCTGMVDGGKMKLDTEHLLARAYLAMKCVEAERKGVSDTLVNNWNQCKKRDKTTSWSRFGMDVEIELPFGQWLDIVQEYVPVLPGMRLWTLSGRRQGEMTFEGGETSQSFLRVWHRALVDTSPMDRMHRPVPVLDASGELDDGICKSSFNIVWPDIHPEVGDTQKSLAMFVQERTSMTFGPTFASTPIHDMIDITSGPYNARSGGGARFIYDDKRKATICKACNANATSAFTPRALYCSSGTCLRLPQLRPKRPWAALAPHSQTVCGSLSWSDFVLLSSVWSDQKEATPMTIELTTDRQVWRKDRDSGQLECKLSRSDTRIIAIEQYWKTLAPRVGPCPQVDTVSAFRRKDDTVPLYYCGNMKRTTVSCCWCLNRPRPEEDKHCHKNITYFLFYSSSNRCVIGDWSCRADYKNNTSSNKKTSAYECSFPLSATVYAALFPTA